MFFVCSVHIVVHYKFFLMKYIYILILDIFVIQNLLSANDNINNLCKEALHNDAFLIERSYSINYDSASTWYGFDAWTVKQEGPERRWCSIIPENMVLKQVLAEILLGYHGQEPLWRLRAGAINSVVNWRCFGVAGVLEESLKNSFQFLRQIVEKSSEIKATPRGLVIKGESGAKYLLRADETHHAQSIPQTIVLNAPSASSSHGSNYCYKVCISLGSIEVPLGDRIAALALGLVNDVKTARKIKPLANIVDEFLEPGWR